MVHKVRVASYLCSQTYKNFIVRNIPGIWHELRRDRGQKICQYFPEPAKVKEKILHENNKDSYQFHTSH